MLWHGRPNGCGLWLPEDKRLIFGMDWKNVVAYETKSMGGLRPSEEK